jgi:hypothetical protein
MITLRARPRLPFPAVVLVLLAAGCNGEIIGGASDDDPPPPPPGEPDPPGLDGMAGPPLKAPGGRRLSREEIARSLQRLLGKGVPADTSLLPAETLTPFDNDALEQNTSVVLVESMEGIAAEAATWATAAERLPGLLPCTPSGSDDQACFQRFLEGFGRRALRHPLTQEDTGELLSLLDYARQSGRFADAVAMAVRVFLMHPEFLYRVEPGVALTDAGRTRLSGYEIATRLSFLLQGSTPDDALLTAAGDGTLDSAAGRRAQAERLLAAEEGREQIRRFHAFWLGYSRLNLLPIHGKLRAETDALVDRATAPARDFRYLLLADETRVDAELAEHYDLSEAPADSGWVSYGDAPRRGILTHGMFAAAGSKFSGTSPTRRGKFIRERFFCQTVQLPPPGINVDVDVPPAARDPEACKIDRYREHRENPQCADCHALMDPIGFGLENFDQLGRYREHDDDRPECPIDGVGSLDENTTFTGAQELAGLIAESPRLLPCLAEYVIRFAAGRRLEEGDDLRAMWLAQQMQDTGNSFAAMLVAYVSHENFGYRQE